MTNSHIEIDINGMNIKITNDWGYVEGKYHYSEQQMRELHRELGIAIRAIDVKRAKENEMITIKGLAALPPEEKKPRSLDEEFEEEWAKHKKNGCCAESSKFVAKSFFIEGRTSARVFVTVEGGNVSSVLASDGVEVAIIDYDENFFVYEVGGETRYTTNWNEIPDSDDLDDTVDMMDDGDRLERVPEKFKGLKEIEAERY